VVRASGCLDDLSAPQRKVLSARAGVGAGAPRSRTAVARRFDITVKRVVRLERTGLKRLRSLAKGGGCAPPAGAMTTITSGSAPRPATAAVAAPRQAASTKSSGDSTKTSTGKKPSSGSSGEDETPAGGVDPAPEQNRGGVAGVTQTHPPGPNGFPLTIPLIVLALALTALLLARLLRRDRPVVATTADAEPVDSPPERAPWVPWHKSTMTGPGWNEPPESGTEGTWREPGRPADPEPEHEPWSPPRNAHRSPR
jgi:hypothetical protein